MLRMTLILILCGLSVLLPGCKKAAVRQAEAPVVETATVAKGPISEFVAAVGEAKPYDEVDLVARVTGYLQKRNFSEGQSVKKGQLLFEIEPEIYEADVKAAEAALEKARATQRNTTIDYERQQKLVRQDAISERAYDDATTKKMEADAGVKAAEAQLATAKQNLSYTKIYAPFDGWIGLAPVSVGNLVTPQTRKLATLVKTDPMRIEFVVNEMDILSMQKFEKKDNKPDVKIRLFLQDGEEYKKPGEISFWNNTINPSTGTLKLQAVFPNPERKLIPGMFTRLRLEPGKPAEELLVPLSAIMTDQAGDYVYVVAPDGMVSRRTIETGFKDEKNAIVLSNLKPGEQVIVNGVQKVRPGIKAVAKPVAATPANGAK